MYKKLKDKYQHFKNALKSLNFSFQKKESLTLKLFHFIFMMRPKLLLYFKWYFFRKTSIVCLPSYREGLPKCLLEASALGLPIVTTNVAGCRDAIINKKTGLLAKVKNVNSLVSKLSFLIKNKNIRSKYGKNGRDFAIKNFDLDIVIKKNLDIYSNLISKN